MWFVARCLTLFIHELNRFSLKELRNFIPESDYIHISAVFNYFLTIEKHLTPPSGHFLR